MGQSSGFFTSHVVQGMHDRVYTAAQFCEYFSHFIGNGIFPNPSTQLQIVSKSGWEVAMLEGFAWINGYWFKEDREALLTIDFADDYMDRVDAVVLRWNNDDRIIRVHIKKGEPMPGGKKPDIQRDDNIYELCLAYIEVGQGTTQITQANIIDTRLDTTVCGIVHGLVDQVDTSQLFAQLESYIENYKRSTIGGFTAWIEDYKQTTNEGFIAWFDTIKDILDENAAGHLLSMIHETNHSVDEINYWISGFPNETIDGGEF